MSAMTGRARLHECIDIGFPSGGIVRPIVTVTVFWM